MKYIKMKWKKGFRSIPFTIQQKLKSIDEDIRVEAVKSIPKTDIVSGLYNHMGIRKKNGIINFPDSIVPESHNGIASKYNRFTKTIIHKDLEKVIRSWFIIVPNFGDWSYGHHYIYRSVNAYPRTDIEPLYLSIIIEKLKETDTDIVLRFSIDRIISRDDDNFDNDLLNDLCLLQENVGACDIFPVNAKSEEYLENITVGWEILPPGTKDEVLSVIIGTSKYSPKEISEIGARYDVIKSLKPKGYIHGLSNNHRYFGAKIREDIIIFENLTYGNAIYILGENWEELSKKSRLELQKYHKNEIIRIVHSDNWKLYLKHHVNDLLSNNP